MTWPEHTTLVQIARSRTEPLRRVQRAKVALAAAAENSNAAITRELGLHIAKSTDSRSAHQGNESIFGSYSQCQGS